MSLYTSDDIDLLSKEWNNIMVKVEERRATLLEPNINEMKEVHKIILDFIKQNKRKIYGGYGINLLIKQKNPKDAIYREIDVPDVDFYSPEPIVDLMKLCNILHERGFKRVNGKESQHQETYNVTVNYAPPYCDISYVPTNIYNRIPYREIDGYMVTHPNFMTIDYLRMMNDPLVSYWRFGSDLKALRRFHLIQKYYPLPHVSHPTKVPGPIAEVDVILDNIFKFMLDRQSIVVIGFYAYNYFMEGCGILKKSKSEFKLQPIPYYEFISTDYRNDVLDLIKILKSIVTIDTKKIEYDEFYPFFQFTSFSVEIYFDDNLVARIYDYGRKCIPYQDVPALKFQNGEVTKVNATIRLATYMVNFMYVIIQFIQARVNDNNNDNVKDLIQNVYSNLMDFRKYYLDSQKKKILDKSIFEEFVIDCVGATMTPERERRLLSEIRRKKNKRISFLYDPSSEGIKEPVTTYIFQNSSGNRIKNPKNMKLGNYPKESNVDVEDEVLEE